MRSRHAPRREIVSRAVIDWTAPLDRARSAALYRVARAPWVGRWVRRRDDRVMARALVANLVQQATVSVTLEEIAP